jgi:hypothetical protein
VVPEPGPPGEEPLVPLEGGRVVYEGEDCGEKEDMKALLLVSKIDISTELPALEP